MLLSLHIKDLALIHEEEISFGEHLNILTGETGAGKSVIIGSVMMAMGAKADRDVIRDGAEFAQVELIFGLDGNVLDGICDASDQGKTVGEFLSDMGIPIDEDRILIITRRITPNRSIYRANGCSITASQVRALTSGLMDIHGQYEHQNLLKKSNQAQVLDNYCHGELSGILAELKDEYAGYRSIVTEIEHSSMDEDTVRRERDMASFALDEIDNAGMKQGEEEELDVLYRRISNSRKIGDALGRIYSLTGGDSESGASELLGEACREIGGIVQYDRELIPIRDMLFQTDSLIGDLNRTIADYMEEIAFDGDEYSRVEKRLMLIRDLKAKYGKTLEEVQNFRDIQEKKLEKFGNYSEYMAGLERDAAVSRSKIMKLCSDVSEIRRRGAERLSGLLKEALLELNFQHVDVRIMVMPDEGKISAAGYDDIEFMVSLNPGESLRPLKDVASGGELSRIMLGLKSVLAGVDHTESLIFDEIDTGISGRTAWKVSQQMGILSEHHQIICITHLPQIAAMADHHFLIEKNVEEGRSVTRIRLLEGGESDEELARMMGTEDISEQGINSAREMRKQAEAVKKNRKQ